MGIQLSGGGELAALQPGAFWAKITGNAAGTNRYAWTQIDTGDTAAFDTGLAAEFAATGTSAADGAPAYEVNGRTDVATGTRVLLYPMGDFTFYGFAAPATNGAATYLAPVRVATTTAGTLATSFENGDTVDGVVLATGDRILIKDQSTASENGVYVVAASGAPARASDADSGAELYGALVPVTNGTTNGDTLWMCTVNSVPTVGSTSLAWVKIGPSGGVTGSGTGACLAFWDGVGAGITALTSNADLSIDPSTGTLSAVATGSGVDGIYATRISCDSVFAEHTSSSTSASLYTVPFGGGDERAYLQLFGSPYTQAIYAGTSTTPANAVIVQTDGGTGYLRLNGTAYMHDANTGYTGTPGPGFTTSGGLVVTAGSGSFVGTASANTFTNTNTFPNTGLRALDTNGSHGLAFAPGSDLTADRTLTITTGDANRTLDISAGNVTVTTAGNALTSAASAGAQRTVLGLGTGDSPTFTGATLSSGGLTITAGGLTVSAGGASITGTVTGTLFSGSGASLTALNAGALSSGTVAVARGGTGTGSTPTNGQLLIGNGTDYTLAALTAGSGVSVTNGSGSITIAATGTLDITGLTAADPADGDEVPIYDVSASANRKVTVQEIVALSGLMPGGRLSGNGSDPVTTSDVSPSTLTYLPFLHNRVPLWDGTRWLAVELTTNPTLVLFGLTASKPYDVFGYLSAGTMTLESLVWTNDTTRATDVTIQDGRYCKSGDKTRLYLGTFYTTATDTTTDSISGRYLWNAYNRVPRVLRVTESTDQWNYTTATFRSWNNSTTNRVNVVIGLNMEPVEVTFQALAVNSSAAGVVAGIGLDSTSANAAQIYGMNVNTGAGVQQVLGHYDGFPGIGFHFFQALEYSQASGTTTWYGDAGNSTIYQAGMYGRVWA